MRLRANLAWVVLGVLAGCRQPAAPTPQQGADSAKYPPAVLTGDAELVCSISSKGNGHQKLTLKNGSGIEFDAVVSPIIDGRVIAHGPDKGGAYQFTSHLAKPGRATLPGVGGFDLDELETKVAVEMKRYKQPLGRGTELAFVSADMESRGIYVEFAGRGHAANGDRFTFRINLGAPTDGHGQVVPTDDNEFSGAMSKMVVVRAPTTTVLVTTTLERGR
jgi:hypothetical protein